MSVEEGSHILNVKDLRGRGVVNKTCGSLPYTILNGTALKIFWRKIYFDCFFYLWIGNNKSLTSQKHILYGAVHVVQ